MKKAILFLFMSLLMTGSAFARCQMSIDDFTVTPDELGTELELSIKAEFSARVSAWQLDLTYPEGITPTYAELDDGGIVNYLNSKGRPRSYTPNLLPNADYTNFFTTISEMGYMYDPDVGDYTCYGTVKWEAGEYDMIVLYVQVSEDFHGGEIIINTTCSSGMDMRGGTVRENGDHCVTFTSVCNISVEGSATPEAYACLTPSDSTLAFYYDNQRSFREGTTYNLNTGYYSPRWFSDYKYISRVVFDPSFADARPTTTHAWFYGMIRLKSITGMEYLNTSNVTDMGYMFYQCYRMTSLDLSHFNTSNVTDMSYMFDECFVTSLDLSSFNTANVTNMRNMFSYSTIESLNVSSFNTSNVTDMCCMFAACPDLKSLDVSSFNTSNVTNMGTMFDGCSSLESLDVSGFNTSKVTDMQFMFYNCPGLTSLDLSNFNTSNVTNMAAMFKKCSGLTTIYAGDGWNTAAVTVFYSMFEDCTNLVGDQGTTYDANHVDVAYAHLDGGPSNPGYFSEKGPEAYACLTPSDSTLTFYYDNQRSFREGTTYDLNTGQSDPGWFSIRESVTQVVFDPSFADARPTTTYYWFRNMSNLQSITGMQYLNTVNVEDMYAMFSGCSGLTSLDLSHFDTSNVTNMHLMFERCSSLESLDLSSFNTSHVTFMSYMFNDCSSLENLDVSSFNTANVTSMDMMFGGCRALKSLNLSNFNTAKVIGIGAMFLNCFNLKTIYVGSGWTTDAVTSSNLMFMNCINLVGGMGTTYDADHIDASYAHIDGGSSNPGYFTAEGDEPWTGPEAYACYTPDNTTLTFYYDNQRTSREGTTYFLNEGSNKPGWFDVRASITEVVFDPSFANARPTTTYYWFGDMSNLQSITALRYLNVRAVTDMRFMFCGCALTSLDLRPFDTWSLTDMYCMFLNCTALTTLDLSSFNTFGVTDMESLFDGCSNLKTIYVGDEWNTTNVHYWEDMFYGCTSLVGGMGTTYDEGHTGLSYAHIDGGPSDPGYLSRRPQPYAVLTQEDETLTFYYDGLRSSREGLTFQAVEVSPNGVEWEDYIDVISRVVFDPSFADYRPTSTGMWFMNLSRLTSIIGMENLNTEEVTIMGNMFGGCTALTTLDLSTFNTANVENMYSMFDGCSNLSTIYVGEGWTTDAVTISEEMFDGCTSLVGGMGTTYDANHTDVEYAHIDGGPSNPGYFSEKPQAGEAQVLYDSETTTLTFTCGNQRGTRSGTAYDLNTGATLPEWVTDGTYRNVTRVVFEPSFAAASPTTTYYWFNGMANLVSVTGMEYLHTDCVTDMSLMFANCRNLTSLDLSHFNTSNVTTMESMFENCYGLRTLDLSSFNTDNVTTMYCMFFSCIALTSVDLSSFTNARVTRTSNMFDGCPSLTTIYASSSWYLPANNDSWAMFMDCTSLVGGKGTTYDENHVDAEYAHIDGGPSNPGYFTEKPSFLRGDVDGNGSIGISDVSAIIDYLLSGDDSDINLSAADADQNGSIGIADVSAIIDYLLSGAW